jgi:chromosomal replication initiation ATPase DnaA
VPLAGVPGVEPRLRTRLEGGLVVELPPPDEDIRGRVIARLLSEKLGGADAALVSYLAARPAESVRAVLGLVQRVIEAAEARGAAPTAGLAREVLEGPIAPAPAPSDAERRRPPRSSGIVAPTAGGARSREKMVWEWPDVGERVLEEWR